MKSDDTYLRGFAAAGFSVDDIDFVMCTHLHVDHVGWNTRLENGRWVPTFPKARYVFAKQEFDYWTEQNAKAEVPPFADSVLPVVEAKRHELVGNDHQIGDHVRILPTPGHTPGHIAITMGHGKDDAVFSGDLMHSPIQTLYPELSVEVRPRSGQGGNDAPQLPGTLLRHRHAVLHRAFPLAVGREDPAQGQRLRLRGGVAISTEWRDTMTTLPEIPLPAGIRSRYVDDINGLRMHVLEAGFETKGRPCILLLHGFPELAFSWRKVMPALSSAGIT